MTVEIRPMGNKCNLRCEYCYQNPVRDKNQDELIDEYKLKTILNKTDGFFVLFGGEALTAPIEVIEKVWKYGYENNEKNSIQTNATLITDKHIELMKKYNVHAGVSLDGKEELNDLRWAGNLEKTRKLTKKSNDNIEKMLDNGVSVSLIITLHSKNVSPEKIDKFKEWLRHLDNIGINSCRFHLLEKEGIGGDDYALSSEEYLEALIDLYELHEELDMRIDKYSDIIKLLKGEDNRVTCTWTGCDPWRTNSVVTIDYEGNKGCGRPHKDGMEWNKSNNRTFDRTIMLYETPQEEGGCKDCEYFSMCRGQCAGTGIDGDWRNRSEYCEVWKGLFDFISKKLKAMEITPTHKLNNIKEIENKIINAAKNDRFMSISRAKKEVNQSNHSNCKTGKDGARLTHNDSNPYVHQDKGHRHEDHSDTRHEDSNPNNQEEEKEHIDELSHVDHLDTGEGN